MVRTAIYTQPLNTDNRAGNVCILICLRTEVMTKATNSIGVVVGKSWEPITGSAIYRLYVRLSAILNVWQYRSMKHESGDRRCH